MRTVFSNQQLAHVWASQKQEQGRNPSNTMFFRDKKIYSYGLHYTIAQFHGAIVLVNSHNYSNSTCKQRNDVHSAISHLASFMVPNVNDPLDKANIEHLESRVIESFINCLNDRAAKNSWSVSDKNYALENLVHVTCEFNQYCKAFNIKDQITLDTETLDLINEFFISKTFKTKIYLSDDNVKKRQVESEKRRALEQEKQVKEQEEKMAKWLSGENVGYVRFQGQIKLRIKGDIVETSQGATVPLSDARQFVMLLKNNALKEGTTVGHFTFNRIENDCLVIGCHKIPLSEVNRVFGDK